MSRLIQYLREIKTELTKVIWPSRRDTVKMTAIVIALSVFVAFFLGAVDLGLTEAVGLLFTR